MSMDPEEESTVIIAHRNPSGEAMEHELGVSVHQSGGSGGGEVNHYQVLPGIIVVLTLAGIIEITTESWSCSRRDYHREV